MSRLSGSPFLTHVALRRDRVTDEYPFTIPLLRGEFSLDLTTPVTFLVGDNGTGKSTLLEALAWSAGFGALGGSRDQRFEEETDGHALGRALTLGWKQRTTDGFFLRAETFYQFASELEATGTAFGRYGGQSLHTRSHGEAFLALFEHRFEDGLYILDEPEAALSPQRQLAFLRILHSLTAPRLAQFIIATHSPMLLTLPGATILSLEDGELRQVEYTETEHYQLTRSFLEAPERFYRHLLQDADDDES